MLLIYYFIYELLLIVVYSHACFSHSKPTYALDVEALRWFQGPSGPSVPEDLQVNLFPLDQQHALVYPAEEEDLGQGVRERPVPEVLHVHGFEIGEHLVAAMML